MHKNGESVHLSEEEASGGRKNGYMRYVLLFGTLLAIVVLSAIWIGGAWFSKTENAGNPNADPRGQVQDQHLGAPLPAQTSDNQQTVENNLPVVKN